MKRASALLGVVVLAGGFGAPALTPSCSSGAPSAPRAGPIATSDATDAGDTGSAGADAGPSVPPKDPGLDASIDLEPEPEDAAFEACEADESTAKRVGLDMYVVLDRTASMAQRPNVETTLPQDGDCLLDLEEPPSVDSKWCLATTALARFFTASTERDVRVAFQFMNPDENADICGPVDDNPHATPAIDFTPLPVSDDDELLVTIEEVVPTVTATRMEGALNGIALFTASSEAPPRQMIGILITDGDPHNSGVGMDCDTEIQDLARIASDHFEATGIPIFVIGMTGATPENLQALAVSGGGPEHGPDEFCETSDSPCNYWSVGDGDPEAFVRALEGIREAATIPCEYNLPETGGLSLDPALVQVEFKPADGTEATAFRRVDGVDACGETGGWYYDDDERPSSIHLCPASCQIASDAVTGDRVTLLYGCLPEIK